MRNKNPIRKYLRFTKLFNNKFSNLASLGIYSKSVIALKNPTSVAGLRQSNFNGDPNDKRNGSVVSA